MADLLLDPSTTAVVHIDLQRAIVGMQTAPYPAMEVVAKCGSIAEAFRKAGSPIVYVRVDLANFVELKVDKPLRDPNAPPPPAAALELVPEAGLQPGDIVITKRNWSAFSGTDLEQQLRAKGITTIVLGGIATNFGVEAAARSAIGCGFDVVFAEDAMTSVTADAHRFAVENIFGYLGRVRSTTEVISSIG